MAALEEHLTAGLPDSDEERDRFRIDSADVAEWALRKLAKARRRKAEAVALADAERARIDEWLDGETARLDRDESFFVGVLQDWHYRTLKDEPDRKTIRLPAGTLRARKAPDALVVDLPRVFIEWAEGAHPELLRTTVQPDKQAIKQFATPVPVDDDHAKAVDPDTGEELPGVAFVTGDTKFTVDTDGTAS